MLDTIFRLQIGPPGPRIPVNRLPHFEIERGPKQGAMLSQVPSFLAPSFFAKASGKRSQRHRGFPGGHPSKY